MRDVQILLTERFKLIEADCALPLRRLNTARVEYVIAFKQPDFLLVPLQVEFQLAVVAPVRLIDDATLQITRQNRTVPLHVPFKQSLRSQQNFFRI